MYTIGAKAHRDFYLLHALKGVATIIANYEKEWIKVNDECHGIVKSQPPTLKEALMQSNPFQEFNVFLYAFLQ